ncbi:xylulose kinase [Hyalella azteca]|uniref:Xylulose kinase n=1 Tax=Hyalella azteca TaxID=294128 RepID=A0A8B7NW81_HYAAZ|nr:xylulose kinase [Hyalella azteca]
MEAEPPKLSTYLGFDFSTQQVKALVIADDLKVLQEAAVHFDSELPEFRTQGGVIQGANGEVTSPVVMWIKALDLVLDKLRVAGTDFSTVAALSGSGQQHGSVWWKRGTREVLTNLDPQKFLHHQLNSSLFSRPNAPVWMDVSTTIQCQMLEEKLGGAQRLADISGSRAYERFTGNQIARTHSTNPDIYGNTEHISLVSSFACSLMLGDYAPIDLSDGSGMNLLDINTKDWHEDCLKACGVGLRSLLGSPVPSNTVVGKVSNFYVERYGFSAECNVVAFTGDNPSSLAAMRLDRGDVALSLGTSDTLFLSTSRPTPGLEGHVFVSPIDPDLYMGMLCFSNGSLTREGVRDKCAEGSWDIFSELLESTPRGNFGNMGGSVGSMGGSVGSMGGSVGSMEKCRVLATGGASRNKALLQIAADVFQAPVYTMNVSNSAALGGAYRAKHAFRGGAYEDVIPCPTYTLATEPAADASKIYGQMLDRLDMFEQKLLAESGAT